VNAKQPRLLTLIRLTRPVFLLGGFLLFGLGAAIAHYLGKPLDVGLYLGGQALVTLVQLTAQYLNEYFDAPIDNANEHRTFFSGGSGVLVPGSLSRRIAMYAAMVCVTLAATLTSVLLFSHRLPVLAWVILAVGFTGSVLYSLPPVRLVSSGIGEIVASVIVAGLVPSFSYAIQTGEMHRLLLMSTVPLMAIHFAMLIVFQMPDYSADVKYEKRTLMVRLGWRTAFVMHDAALVLGFGSLLLAFFFGLPRRVALGTLIALPLAIAQVWQISRIREGYPPRWRILTAGSALLLGLMAYLELIGYVRS
jgi:1,4-dihydroxy-2-naphthoate octaprenyltransferase